LVGNWLITDLPNYRRAREVYILHAMAANYKYALVRWTSGDDAGRLSVVEIDCIRGDTREFDSNGKPVTDDSSMVEWRQGKRDKRTGWSMFVADIIQVSRID